MGAPGSSGLVDTRILGKPKPFSGKSAEWKDWSFVLYGFCGAVAEVFEQRMRHHAHMNDPILLSSLSELDPAPPAVLSPVRSEK